jgi:hypothetical protein
MEDDMSITAERTTDDGMVPVEVEKAARGEELTDAEEKGALAYLLGPTKAVTYKAPVAIETQDGEKTLYVHFAQQDGAKIIALDTEHRTGEGPFARLNVPEFNIALVQEALTHLTDTTGARVNLKSPEFIGGHPEGLAGALRLRFKVQRGIFNDLAAEIQRVSGYGGDRVGTAQRSLVDAAGNS